MEQSRQHTLFLMIGHSGVGKTTLLKQLCLQDRNLPVLTKLTTRQQRITDDFRKEIITVNDTTFDKLSTHGFIGPQYIKYGKKYGYLSHGRKINIEGTIMTGIGLDSLHYSNVIAVGDLYESQRVLREWVSKLIVILMYASPISVHDRLIMKDLPRSQLEKRLSSLNDLDSMGNPKNFSSYNYAISTNKSITESLYDLQVIISSH